MLQVVNLYKREDLDLDLVSVRANMDNHSFSFK